eukprot:7013907-Pyramimonas_sp.AAC.1
MSLVVESGIVLRAGARAVLCRVRRAPWASRGHGKRLLVFGDSLASVSAASRMRARSRAALGIVRRIGALSLASGSSF